MTVLAGFMTMAAVALRQIAISYVNSSGFVPEGLGR